MNMCDGLHQGSGEYSWGDCEMELLARQNEPSRTAIDGLCSSWGEPRASGQSLVCHCASAWLPFMSQSLAWDFHIICFLFYRYIVSFQFLVFSVYLTRRLHICTYVRLNSIIIIWYDVIWRYWAHLYYLTASVSWGRFETRLG